MKKVIKFLVVFMTGFLIIGNTVKAKGIGESEIKQDLRIAVGEIEKYFRSVEDEGYTTPEYHALAWQPYSDILEMIPIYEEKEAEQKILYVCKEAMLMQQESLGGFSQDVETYEELVVLINSYNNRFCLFNYLLEKYGETAQIAEPADFSW